MEPEGTGDITPGSNQLHSAVEDDDKMIVEPNEFEPRTFVDVLVQAKQRDQWQERHRARLPIRYRVYILTQTFAEIEKQMPQLVEATGEGLIRPERDLQLREALESTKLSGASMIADGIWVGRRYESDAQLRKSLIPVHPITCSWETVEMIPSDLIEFRHGWTWISLSR